MASLFALKHPLPQMYGVLALKVRVIWNLAAVATEAVAMDARLSATSYLPGGDLARCPLRLLVQKCRIGNRLDVRLPHWRQCSCRRRGCRWICCGSRRRVDRNGRGQHPVGQHLSEPRPRKWTCHRPSQWRVGPPPPFSPLFPPSPSLWVEWSLPARGGPEIRVPGA